MTTSSVMMIKYLADIGSILGNVRKDKNDDDVVNDD